MTAEIAAEWWSVPDTPPTAAPIRAVDGWRAELTSKGLNIVARVQVRGDDPNLRGHFPGQAVYPGVFTVETLCQAMALAAPGSPHLHLLRSVRFLAALLDGDELRLYITATHRPGDEWEVTAKGSRARDGVTVARLRALFGPALPPLTPSPAEPATGPASGPATGVATGVIEHSGVRTVLPQRHPLLLVDRVLHREPGSTVAAVKAITGNEPCYADLPDGAGTLQYRYPPSLLIESFGQSAALLWLDGPTAEPGSLLMFVGARDVRLHAAVGPGDVLHHHVRLETVIADTAFATGEVLVGGVPVATVTGIVATRRPLRATDLVPPGTGPNQVSPKEGTR